MRILAADFGGTTIKFGLVENDRVLVEDRMPAKSGEPLAPRLSVLQGHLEELCGRASLSTEEIDGLAFAFPSLLNRERTRITSAPEKYSDATDIDWMHWSRDAMGCPLVLENDVVSALLGEWKFGAGRGSDHLLMLKLGTGVGSAVVQDGRVLRGSHGAAGVLGGHLTIKVDGDPCYCGNVGCVETEASTWTVQDQMGDEVDLAWLFDGDDPDREFLRDQVLRGWGAALVNLVHAYDPARVVVAGGPMGSREQILPALRSYVDQHAWRPRTADALPIVLGDLGDRAPFLGLTWRFEKDAPPTTTNEQI